MNVLAIDYGSKRIGLAIAVENIIEPIPGIKNDADVFKNINKSNNVNCIWGDAFKNIINCEDQKYDHLFIDLNDDPYCINLAEKNIDNVKRIVKKDGVITVQVGSKNKKPKQKSSNHVIIAFWVKSRLK